jgi:hypothetical protein
MRPLCVMCPSFVLLFLVSPNYKIHQTSTDLSTQSTALLISRGETKSLGEYASGLVDLGG